MEFYRYFSIPLCRAWLCPHHIQEIRRKTIPWISSSPWRRGWKDNPSRTPARYVFPRISGFPRMQILILEWLLHIPELLEWAGGRWEWQKKKIPWEMLVNSIIFWGKNQDNPIFFQSHLPTPSVCFSSSIEELMIPKTFPISKPGI